ncbi:tail protein X [Bradyrhizobium ottawaense]|uniref:P2-like prophage tail protein X n=1 Tax=Bradyrhizobium ottawaense TaxID=931866 RepID=A0ABY0QH32_9BRAD|nr:tail protein X [Bradyrhizobium ottawaense]SDK39763.1 P2-like prophage tail protein X [Bradyrhizobium ottawaense]
MSTYITKLYDRLDVICYARYGSTANQIVEWVIEQNPGVELYGIVLPLGISIELPEPPRQLTQPPVIQQVFLWK